MQVMVALALGLLFFDFDSALVCIRILADARYLPGNSHTRCATRDLETVIGNLFSYVNDCGVDRQGAMIAREDYCGENQSFITS
jgi:hypothetical protein